MADPSTSTPHTELQPRTIPEKCTLFPLLSTGLHLSIRHLASKGHLVTLKDEQITSHPDLRMDGHTERFLRVKMEAHLAFCVIRNLQHDVVVKGKGTKVLPWDIIPRWCVVYYLGRSRSYNQGISEDPKNPITILTYHLRDVHCRPIEGIAGLVDGKYLSPEERNT